MAETLAVWPYQDGPSMTRAELAVWEREARAGRLPRRFQELGHRWTEWLEAEARKSEAENG